MRATRVAAIGPRNGISEMVSAADAPTKAGMSAFSEPRPYDTQLPMLGLPIRMEPVFI